MQPLLDFWPIMLVAGGGLIAWGRISARLSGVEKLVDSKASSEVVERISGDLARIEGKVDRLLERGAA